MAQLDDESTRHLGDERHDGTGGLLWSVFPDPILRIAGVADFNGDGLSDSVWTGGFPHSCQVWEMAGRGVRSIGAYTLRSGDALRALGDFDRHGVADMVWRDTTGANQMWQMRNSRIYASDSILRSDPSWSLLGPR